MVLEVVSLLLLIQFAAAADYNAPLTANICTNISVSEGDVRRVIFADSSSWERPRLNNSDPVIVNIRLVLSSIAEVVEKYRVMKITGYVYVRWYDELHRWNRTFPYSCVDSIAFEPKDRYWIPDIITNSENRRELMTWPGEKVIVWSTGLSSWVPGGTITFYCEFDLTWFPFDEQECGLLFQNWKYANTQQKLAVGDPPISIKYWLDNQQWSLISAKARTNDVSYIGPNAFDQVEFVFKIRRKAMHYMINVVVPSTLISLVELVVFTLPTGDVYKVHISATCLLAYSMFQSMIVADMPASSDHTPFLEIYIYLQMAYITAAILGQGIVFVALGNARTKQNMPYEMLRAAKLFGKCVFLSFHLSFKRKGKRKISRSDVYTITSVNDVEHHKTKPIEKHFGDYISILDHIFPEPETMDKIHDRHMTLVLGEHTNNPPSTDDPNRVTADEYLKQSWLFVVSVIERWAVIFYAVAIVATPLVFFVIVPASKQRL